jgi:hypothetical protein
MPSENTALLFKSVLRVFTGGKALGGVSSNSRNLTNNPHEWGEMCVFLLLSRNEIQGAGREFNGTGQCS